MNRKGSTIIIVLVAVILTLAITFMGMAAYFKFTDKVVIDRNEYRADQESDKKYDKFFDIQRLIENSYLWEYDQDEELEAIYRAMLDSLGDQYSRYLSEEELTALLQTMNSNFTGIGIVVMNTDEGYLVTEVMKDGPAQSVGIKEGDYILKVDGKTYDSLDETTSAIRGEAGTRVKVTMLRGEEEIDFDVVRGEIDGTTVDSTVLEEELGYIYIKSFGDDTADEFAKALSNMESQNVKGLIIDMRNNPGGMFDAGVEIADRILPEGIITYTEDKNGNRENYNSDSKHTDLPMAVLINGATGSTSEMLAAALKDNGAILIGTTTYGKGVMQETHMYGDGTAVNVTTRQFFSPKGNPINGVGVEPNEVVPLAEGLEDTQLNRAIELLKMLSNS